MDKFGEIKRAHVRIRRNKHAIKRRPKIFWRYVIAALLVYTVSMIDTFTDWNAADLFRQNYIEQYEKE